MKTRPDITKSPSGERRRRTPWHICCLEAGMQASAVTRPAFSSLTVKGAIAFSLVLSALPLGAGELPSLRSPMARYETGSQHYAPVARPSSVPLSDLDFAVPSLPRIVFNIEESNPANPPATLSPRINPRYLAKAPMRSYRWLAKDNSGGSVGLGRFLVGYGSVYYDSFYDKPMVFFEGKGTRVEEPGCGYLKMSFNF